METVIRNTAETPKRVPVQPLYRYVEGSKFIVGFNGGAIARVVDRSARGFSVDLSPPGKPSMVKLVPKNFSYQVSGIDEPDNQLPYGAREIPVIDQTRDILGKPILTILGLMKLQGKSREPVIKPLHLPNAIVFPGNPVAFENGTVSFDSANIYLIPEMDFDDYASNDIAGAAFRKELDNLKKVLEEARRLGFFYVNKSNKNP